jgi:hypothetical protein
MLLQMASAHAAGKGSTEWLNSLGGAQRMRRRIISQFAVVLSCLAGHAIAGTTLTLTGAGNYTVLDGIYVSPYTATVGTIANTPVICDDFVDEVTLGESWNTSVGTVGSTATGLFGTENSRGYGEVAWLSEQLLANESNSLLQGQISYAIWSVFEGSAVTSWLNAWGDTTTEAGVAYWLGQAAANVPGPGSGSTFSNVTVYTPSPSGLPGTPGQAQEFLVVGTPEASSVANLAVDFLAFGALLFVFRRNKFATR